MDSTLSTGNPTLAAAHDLRSTPLRYTGEAGTLFRIWLLNLLLNICTIGIYSFWGRTRLRRYVTGRFALLSDSFEYAGTAKELLFGFLIAFPFLLGLGLVSLVTQQTLDNPVDDLLVFVLAYFFFNVGYYASLRYRMSRTLWRGVRGRQAGSAWSYGCRALGCVIVDIVSLGLLIPVTDRLLMSYRMRHAGLGDTMGTFGGSAKDLYATHMLTAALAIPTLGLSRFWYQAALQRHQYGNFAISNVGFRCSYTGGAMLGLFAVNLLILVLTLGFGTALVIHRNARFFAENISVTGDIDAVANAVAQSTADLSKTGEGLAGVLDADVGFV